MRSHLSSRRLAFAAPVALCFGLSACSSTKAPQGEKRRSGDGSGPALEGSAKTAEAADPPPSGADAAPKIAAQPAAQPSVEGSAQAPHKKLPAVDQAAAQALAEALRSVDEGSAAQVAAAGLAELEAERLPEYLTTALKDYAEVAPEQRSMVVSREMGTVDGQNAWDKACAGGMIVFQEVAVAPADEKSGILFERCNLGRFGLFDASAAQRADPSALLLATMTAEHLQSNASLSDAEGFAISKLTAPPGAP